MRVKATKKGFRGGIVYNVDDTFTVPEGTLSDWFIPADPAQVAAYEAKREAAHKKRLDEIRAKQAQAAQTTPLAKPTEAKQATVLSARIDALESALHELRVGQVVGLAERLADLEKQLTPPVPPEFLMEQEPVAQAEPVAPVAPAKKGK